jgi:serine/threonine protein kinase
MAEISSGKFLFPGTTEKAQLDCIFSIMGTPTEKTWSGLEKFPMYEQTKPTWNNHNAQNLRSLLPNLGSTDNDLLQGMLQLCPEKRITAAKTLEHPWLKDADKGNKK